MAVDRDAPMELWYQWMYPGVSEEERYEAYEELVTRYLYLVEAIVRKMKHTLPTFLDEDDLMSHGKIGLLKAMNRYDPEVGKFSRYASAVIWGAVIDGLRSNDSAPRWLRKWQQDFDNAVSDLRDEDTPYPTDAEVADHLDITIEEVRDIKTKLETTVVEVTDPELMPHPATPEISTSSPLCEEFVVWLQEFPELHQKVIAMRYWKGIRSNSTIAKELGSTTELVSLAHKEVLSQLLPAAQSWVVSPS